MSERKQSGDGGYHETLAGPETVDKQQAMEGDAVTGLAGENMFHYF